MPDADRRRLRRTPCIGVCSTTYGDLVCRGCKRFAHEVVGWNSFADAQRHVVWMRLNRLLAESVRAYITVVDEQRLRSVAPERVPDADDLPVEVVAFRTMCARPLPMAALGLAARGPRGACPWHVQEPSAGDRETLAPRIKKPADGSAEATRETVRWIDAGVLHAVTRLLRGEFQDADVSRRRGRCASSALKAMRSSSRLASPDAKVSFHPQRCQSPSTIRRRPSMRGQAPRAPRLRALSCEGQAPRAPRLRALSCEGRPLALPG